MNTQEIIKLIDYAISVHGSPLCIAALNQLRDEFAKQVSRDLDVWFDVKTNYGTKGQA